MKTKREIGLEAHYSRHRAKVMRNVYSYIAWELMCKESFFGRRLSAEERVATIINSQIAYEKWEKTKDTPDLPESDELDENK